MQKSPSSRSGILLIPTALQIVISSNLSHINLPFRACRACLSFRNLSQPFRTEELGRGKISSGIVFFYCFQSGFR
ncbi:hypothetical protein NM65014_2104 [Neisseria meningitidis 65014]|nr:hypothetical protein NM65014_2104 [Neisseria meningitidis 65014]